MDFIFVALLFGVATAAIAKLKGGSVILWFLIGTALPGVGILAALFMRDERQEPRRQCPECGSIVMISDQVCLHCGRDLEFPEPAEAAQNPV